MTDDRDQKLNLNDVADADNRAAAAEANEVRRDDAEVDNEAAGDDVTIPPAAAIDQPNPIPSDGV